MVDILLGLIVFFAVFVAFSDIYLGIKYGGSLFVRSAKSLPPPIYDEGDEKE